RPADIALRKSSRGSSDLTQSGRHFASTHIRGMYETVLITKARVAPTLATIVPPTAGPMLRVTLKPMLFRITAAGRVSRGTVSRTLACQEGLFAAAPVPIRKVSASSVQGVIQPK